MMCITRRELCAEIHQELGPLAGALDWKQQTPSAQHSPPVTFPKKWSSPMAPKSNKPRYISLDVSGKSTDSMVAGVVVGTAPVAVEIFAKGRGAI